MDIWTSLLRPGIVKFRPCNNSMWWCEAEGEVVSSCWPSGPPSEPGIRPWPSVLHCTNCVLQHPAQPRPTNNQHAHSEQGRVFSPSVIPRKNAPKLPNGNSPFAVWRKPKMSWFVHVEPKLQIIFMLLFKRKTTVRGGGGGVFLEENCFLLCDCWR